MREILITCPTCGTTNRTLFDIAAAGFECKCCCGVLRLTNAYLVAAGLTRRPAYGLYVTGLLSLAGSLLMTMAMTGVGHIKDPSMARFMAVSVIVSPMTSLYVLYGAYCLHSMKRQYIAASACLVAMIPFPTSCFFIGIPFGIWGLIVLCRSKVRQQFLSSHVARSSFESLSNRSSD